MKKEEKDKDREYKEAGSLAGSANIEDDDREAPSTDIVEKGVNVKGGVFVGGDVKTGGGDFIGRAVGERGVSIGGDVSGSTIITGDQNTIRSEPDAMEKLKEEIFSKIDALSDLHEEDKSDLKAEVMELFEEVSKGDKTDSNLVQRFLRSIKRISGEILKEVVFALLNPATGISTRVVEMIQSF